MVIFFKIYSAKETSNNSFIPKRKVDYAVRETKFKA